MNTTNNKNNKKLKSFKYQKATQLATCGCG